MESNTDALKLKHWRISLTQVPNRAVYQKSKSWTINYRIVSESSPEEVCKELKSFKRGKSIEQVFSFLSLFNHFDQCHLRFDGSLHRHFWIYKSFRAKLASLSIRIYSEKFSLKLSFYWISYCSTPQNFYSWNVMWSVFYVLCKKTEIQVRKKIIENEANAQWIHNVA